MKKYIAKLIPIEGEIKEGDTVIKKNTTTIRDTWTLWKVKSILNNVAICDSVICDREPYLCDKVYEDLLDIRKEKKVKFFLCSRDIQVGDRVNGEADAYNLGTITRFDKIENAEIVWILEDEDGKEHDWIKSSIYKVIGEISPDATWVKEGDEFDTYRIYKDFIDEKTYVSLLGSCGYFH